MKVAIVSHSFNRSDGMETLVPLGRYAEVLVLGPRIFAGAALKARAPVKVAALPSLRLPSAHRTVILKGLARHLREFKPEVVCVDYDPWHPIFRQVARLAAGMDPSPAIVLLTKKNTFRKPGSTFARLKKFSVKRYLPRVDCIIAASEMSRSMYVEILGVPQSMIVVQPHRGVNTDRFRPAPRTFDRTLRLGFVGEVGTRKGVPELIDAFDAITRAHPSADARLDIVGSCAEPALLQRIQRQPGVTYRDAIANDKIHSFYASLDVFVMPSRAMPDHQEHDGRAVLEAMASGVPCIVSDSGILPEIVGGDDGWVFRAGDVNELRVALEKAILSNERVQMGTKARDKAILASAEAVGNMRLALYRRILEEKR